ncbi:MAG TPA: tetratricopeptide repeat protein [Pyrinomonadaceae bacterium]|nr:tetratricopeptide repeat protein [Pyrinomonadaceae bacterium]
MRRSFQEIRCQRCGAANPLGEELCGRCGTRLMLVVEPSTLRFEEETAGTQLAEGLMERVSLLENHLLRFADRLEKGFELLLKQSQISLSDHTLLESLIDLLVEAGKVDRDKLNSLYRDALAGKKPAGREPGDTEFLRANIIEDYQGQEREVFAELVGRGLELLGAGKTAGAKRELERAAALAPEHATLNFILGLQFFREGKLALARAYLQRAHEAQPASTQVYLLLGIACGDEGEVELARTLLHDSIEKRGSSYAAHYALGRFDALEDNWTGALAHFKQALVARRSAEAHYVLSLTLARLGRLRTALRHARKAVEADENYAAAFQLLGHIQAQLGETKLAQKALATARALDPEANAAGATGRAAGGTKKREAATAVAVSVETLLHNFFGGGRHRRKRLLSGGDKRLADMLRGDALAKVGFGTLTPAH